MEKFVYCAAVLLLLIFVQESKCLPRSASFKPLKAKLQRNIAFKRQGPPPPPPPKPVWEIIGKTREDFINDHKDELTSKVRASITAQMEGVVENITRGMEEFARTLSCMVITMAQGTRSVDADANLNDVKNDIVSEEEAEEKELDDLFTYLGLEEGNQNVLEMVQKFSLPRYVKECQESPIIMDIGNKVFDYIQEFAVCSRLVGVHTEKKMETHDEDSMDSFVDKLEEFIIGALSFTRLYLDYDFGGPGDDGTRRELSDEQLKEIKRVLDMYLSAPLYRK